MSVGRIIIPVFFTYITLPSMLPILGR